MTDPAIKAFIDRANTFVANNAIENKVSELRGIAEAELYNKSVSLRDSQGKRVYRTWRDMKKCVIVFDDGTYIAISHDEDEGISTSYLDVDEGVAAGLVSTELAAELRTAERVWQGTREMIAGREQLRQAIQLLGKDKVKELVNDN